jgi:hypothetical protein
MRGVFALCNLGDMTRWQEPIVNALTFLVVLDINVVEPLVQCDKALAMNMYNVSTEPAPELG